MMRRTDPFELLEEMPSSLITQWRAYLKVRRSEEEKQVQAARQSRGGQGSGMKTVRGRRRRR